MGATHFSRVAAIASDQWGMVTAAQAMAVGTGPQALSRLTYNSALERVGHGIYRLAGAPPGPLDELRAAWLAIEPGRTAAERMSTGPTEVVSHRSAAVAHELGDLEADVMEFTTLVRRQTRRRDVVYHRGILGPEEWTLVDGLPVTAPLRTVTDLAATRTDRGHLAGAVRDAILMHGVPVENAATALGPYARIYGATAGDGNHLISLLLNEIGIPQPALDAVAHIASSGGQAQADRYITGDAIDEIVRMNIGKAFADLASSLDPASSAHAAFHRQLTDWAPSHSVGDKAGEQPKSAKNVDAQDVDDE